MLPEFDANGNLPPGIHACTVEELVSRFGTGSSERIVETKELVQFVAWCRASGINRLLVDGSYTTSKQSPNDVDVVILPGSEHPEKGEEALDGSEKWPFLHIQVALDESDFKMWAYHDFGKSRQGHIRGVVEVELWPNC